MYFWGSDQMVSQDTIRKIITFIDDHIEKTGKTFIDPVEGNQLLERAGILNDSKHRPGLPLRNILRAGLIPHACQRAGKGSSWIIPPSKSSVKIRSNKVPRTEKGEVQSKSQKPDVLVSIKGKINKARSKYRPKEISCLLIAEAPPDSLDRFFYYEDVKRADYLFLGIIEILYPKLKKEYLNRRKPAEWKKKILQKFCADGFYLLDVLDIPLSMFSGYLSSASPDLIKRVKNLIDKNTPIILIKVTTYDAVFENLKNVGFRKIAPIRIPFPGQGQQKVFTEKFRGALKYLGII